MSELLAKSRIAEHLLDLHYITDEQLQTALTYQHKSDKKIGEILIDLGFIEKIKFYSILANQLKMPLVRLKELEYDTSLSGLLPEFQARQFRAAVIRREEKAVQVGMVDPQDWLAVDELKKIIKEPIVFALVIEDELIDFWETVYQKKEKIHHHAQMLAQEIETDDLETLNVSDEEYPVVKLFQSIFMDAVHSNASDIHIEPQETSVRIRVRVDGMLQEQVLDDPKIAAALVQRIKLMSGLNIAEKRIPQDGRFSMKAEGKKYDVRVSTMPIQHGESVVMRILQQSSQLKILSDLDMPAQVLNLVKNIIRLPYGLFLIVGPTGSGKTTTLYSALHELNQPERNIVTVEDPVEYKLPGINQVQINPAIDLTFATVLRAILRQDPNVVMIGEMRDRETVDIALRAAMTGHLVFATLHTQDSISAVTRLLDMGAQSYLIAAVLRGVLAQRLVRKICESCKSDYVLSDNEQTWVQANGVSKNEHFQAGKGCYACHAQGYRGRQGIYELLTFSKESSSFLRENNWTEFEKACRVQAGYQTLVQSGLELAKQGITTLSEVFRVAGDVV